MTTRTPAWRLHTAAVLAAAVLAACAADGPDQLVASAKDYLARKDRSAAVIQLKNALQKDPRHAEARFLLGTLLIEQRDYVSGEKELRRALEYGRAAGDVAPPLAVALLALGRHADVVKELGGVHAGAPAAEAALRTAVGTAQRRLGDAAAATESFNRALAAVPGHPPARLGLAALDAGAGRVEAAIKAADEVIAAQPALGEAWLLRAQIASTRGELEEARRILGKALAADPGNVEARIALVTSLIDVRALDEAAARLAEGRQAASGSDLRLVFLEGLLAQRKGDRHAARERVQQVLKLVPDHVPSLLLQAALDVAENNPASGEASLRRVLARAPEHEGARRLLVAAYLRSGQSTKALEALQPLLKTGKRAEPVLAMLAGETYLANGDIKQAAAYYALASGAEAQQVAARTRLGQIALAAGRTEDGLRELAEAAELDPGQYQADLALITAHLRKNELDKAAAAARALATKQPDNPLSHQMVGVVAAARRDLAGARAGFARALELKPAYMPAVTALANLDLAQGKVDAARQRFETAIAREPRQESAYLALAQLKARSGAPTADVVATLEQAVKVAAPAIDARLMLVAVYLGRGDVANALNAAQAAVAAVPDEPRLLEALAQAQDANGQYNQAIESLNQVVRLQPKSPEPLVRLAALHAKNREPGRAVEAQQRAQLLAPDDVRVVSGLIGLMLAADRVEPALKEARALQSRQPQRAEGFALEGDVFVSRRDWGAAERALREALKREPALPAVAPRLHLALSSAGKTAEADGFARKWLAEHPKDATMRLYLGDRALQQRNLKAAQSMYAEVVALDPNNALALNNLAWVGGELGDERALGHAERAAALAPGNASVLDTLGMLQLAKGDTTRALETLERARRLDASRPTLRLNYAKALLKAGRRDAARTELEALQKLPNEFPGKSEIAGLLKSI